MQSSIEKLTIMILCYSALKTMKSSSGFEYLYPDEDFISARYDNSRSFSGELKKLIILFSTPRSGSTYLSTEIYKKHGIVCHEYTQPYGYLQILAHRWNCIDQDGSINVLRYRQMLVQNRAVDGTLAINVHGSHLKTFHKVFGELIGALEVLPLHLVRADLLKQSMSWALAEATGNWSSHFKNSTHHLEPIESAALIRRSKEIPGQNLAINCYCQLKSIIAKKVLYEDLCDSLVMEKVISDLGLSISRSGRINVDESGLSTKVQRNAESDQACTLLARQMLPFVS